MHCLPTRPPYLHHMLQTWSGYMSSHASPPLSTSLHPYFLHHPFCLPCPLLCPFLNLTFPCTPLSNHTPILESLHLFHLLPIDHPAPPAACCSHNQILAFACIEIELLCIATASSDPISAILLGILLVLQCHQHTNSAPQKQSPSFTL